MDLICSLSPSDWIAIVNILVTSFIGIWIARSVQNSLATNRGLKDHYIEVIRGLNSDYNSFMDSLYGAASNSKAIQEWLKVMNIKLESIEQSVQYELIVAPEVLQNHVFLKHHITGTNEFNDQYNSETLAFNPTSKSQILSLHRNLNNAFVRLIVDVNKAKKRK